MSTRPTPSAASTERGDTSPTNHAARTWSGLRALVLELHDRRKEVRDALGMTVIPGEGATHARRRPLTLRELASRLSTDAPYTTLIVHELLQRGLAARLTHPEDRRSKIVTATQPGPRARS
jgi:hypothetical protein